MADTPTPPPRVPFSCGCALTPRVKGTEMRWFNLLSLRNAAVAADDRDMTAISGAADEGRSRSDVALGIHDRPDPPLSEEIKRRQVALILRYLVAIRVR